MTSNTTPTTEESKEPASDKPSVRMEVKLINGGTQHE